MKDIKELILTTFERDLVLQFLDQFDQIIYNSTINVKTYVTQNLQSPISEFMVGFLMQGGENPETLLSQSKQLRQNITDLPVLVLTIPFAFDQEFSTLTVSKAREITGLPVLIELKTDPRIIGGAIVEGNGRVGEYSFRRYFEKRRQNGL